MPLRMPQGKKRTALLRQLKAVLACVTGGRCCQSFRLNESHNLLTRSVQERVVREIRMLRAVWRELETALRMTLAGHERGNPGHRQGPS